MKYSKRSSLLHSLPGRPKKLVLPGFGGHWVVESDYHLCLEPKIIVSSELTSFKSKKRSVEPNPRRIHPGRKISMEAENTFVFPVESGTSSESKHHFQVPAVNLPAG